MFDAVRSSRFVHYIDYDRFLCLRLYRAWLGHAGSPTVPLLCTLGGHSLLVLNKLAMYYKFSSSFAPHAASAAWFFCFGTSWEDPHYCICEECYLVAFGLLVILVLGFDSPIFLLRMIRFMLSIVSRYTF